MDLTSKIVEVALAKAIERISRKIEKGKKLTDTEVIILLLDGVYRQIDSTRRELTAKIDLTNKRVDDLSRKLEETNKRLEDWRKEFTRRADKTDAKIEEYRRELADKIEEYRREVTERADKTDAKIEEWRRELAERVEEKARELQEYIDVRLSEAEEKARERDLRVARAFTGYQEFLMEFLVVRGVLREEEATVAKGEAKRVMQIAVNPLKKEEWKRIGELLEKDKLTLEEALELRELARRVVEEHGDRYEAWKLHQYASIMVGLAYKREAEEKRKKKQKAAEEGKPASKAETA